MTNGRRNVLVLMSLEEFPEYWTLARFNQELRLSLYGCLTRF